MNTEMPESGLSTEMKDTMWTFSWYNRVVSHQENGNTSAMAILAKTKDIII